MSLYEFHISSHEFTCDHMNFTSDHMNFTCDHISFTCDPINLTLVILEYATWKGYEYMETWTECSNNSLLFGHKS